MASSSSRSFIIAFNQISAKHGHQIPKGQKCTTAPRRSYGSGTAALYSPHKLSIHPPSRSNNQPFFSNYPSKGVSTATYSIKDDIPDKIQQPDPDLTFGSYKIGLAPTNSQLLKADKYFTNSKANPHLLMITPKFRNLPVSDVPEVVFLGRSNVGKSSLLNALLEKNIKELAKTSKHPGHTKTLNAYGVNGVTEYSYTPEDQISGGTPGPKFKKWTGRGGLVVIDTPGYGSASRVEWGAEIMKYLTSRKQLRRAFLLIESEHGLKTNDLQILRLLHDNGIPHQIVFVKSDKIFKPKKPEQTMEKLLEKCGRIRKSAIEQQDPRGKGRRARLYADIIFTSTKLHWPPTSNPANRRKMGIANLRYEVLNACGQSNLWLDPTELVQSPTAAVADMQQSESNDEVVENYEHENDVYEAEDNAEDAEGAEDVGHEQRLRAGGRIRRRLGRRSLRS